MIKSRLLIILAAVVCIAGVGAARAEPNPALITEIKSLGETITELQDRLRALADKRKQKEAEENSLLEKVAGELKNLEKRLRALSLRGKKKPLCETQVVSIPAKLSGTQAIINSKPLFVKGINQRIVVTLTGTFNKDGGGARVVSVSLTDNKGKQLGEVVQKKVDWSASPPTLAFSDFSITTKELRMVTGIIITSIPEGNEKNEFSIKSIAVRGEREAGQGCAVIPDAVFVAKPFPQKTLVKAQTRTVIVRSGSGVGGGGGGSSQIQTRTCLSAVNDTTGGSLAWTSPGSALTSNDERASVGVTGTATTNYLKITNCGFSIPTNATITDITVRWERRSENINTLARDSGVHIVQGDAVVLTVNNALPGSWETTDTVISYSHANWGMAPLNAGVINGTGFGAAISAKTAGGLPSDTASPMVDALLDIAVTYN